MGVSPDEAAAVVAAYLRENNYVRTLAAFDAECPFVGRLQVGGRLQPASAVKSLDVILNEYVALIGARNAMSEQADKLAHQAAEMAQAAMAHQTAMRQPPEVTAAAAAAAETEANGGGADAGAGADADANDGGRQAPVDADKDTGNGAGASVVPQPPAIDAVAEANAAAHPIVVTSPTKTPGGNSRKRKRPRKRGEGAGAQLNFGGAAEAAGQGQKPMSDDQFRSLLNNKDFAARLAQHITEGPTTQRDANGDGAAPRGGAGGANSVTPRPLPAPASASAADLFGSAELDIDIDALLGEGPLNQLLEDAVGGHGGR